MTDQSKIFPERIVGLYLETYTPVVGRITSSIVKTSAGVAAKLRRARLVVATTGNYTLRDQNMSGSITMALTAGVEYMFTVGEVSVAAGVVTIIHDGEQATDQQGQ